MFDVVVDDSLDAPPVEFERFGAYSLPVWNIALDAAMPVWA